MTRFRRTARWWLVPVLLSMGGPAVVRSLAATPGDELKSAIMLSFLRYSEWPDRAHSGGTLTVGVLGRPDMAAVLRRTLAGKPINYRTVRVIELKTPYDPLCCQVIYLATDKPSEIRWALSGARSPGILTIGEADRFLELGGAINLTVVDGRAAFEVDLKTLEQTGVSISSKLLRYGLVRGKAPA